MVEVRIDTVTKRFFAASGQPFDAWLSQMRIQDAMLPRAGRRRTWRHPAMGNPCGEVPMERMSPIDALSCRLVETDGFDASGDPILRVMGGRLHLGAGTYYKGPGDGFDEERETAVLVVPSVYPDTLTAALAGSAATGVIDNPILEGIAICGARSEAGVTHFILEASWEKIGSAARPRDL